MADKILIVDDDPDAIGALKIFLSRQGYQVIIAKNGIEALKMAHQEQPDLIVLDVMMPDMDGFEVARSLHRRPETALIPILMVTARTSVDDKVKGYESGADIYLTKPVHAMDLQANIKALLMQRKARKVTLAERGYMIGVIAARGGVGVSTVALNLAVTYAKKFGIKPVAAELRPGQGTWLDELNISTNHNSEGIDTLLKMGQVEITPNIIENHLVSTNMGVRLLPASNTFTHPDLPCEPSQYEQIITGLGQLSPLTILDIGTYFDTGLPLILDVINEVIIVVEPQSLPVKQTYRMLDLLRTHGFGSSKTLTIITLNHTRSDTMMSISQIEEALQKPVALGFPPALELVAQASRMSLPMVNVQPDGLIAQQFVKLAEMVKKHIETA